MNEIFHWEKGYQTLETDFMLSDNTHLFRMLSQFMRNQVFPKHSLSTLTLLNKLWKKISEQELRKSLVCGWGGSRSVHEKENFRDLVVKKINCWYFFLQLSQPAWFFLYSSVFANKVRKIYCFNISRKLIAQKRNWKVFADSRKVVTCHVENCRS